MANAFVQNSILTGKFSFPVGSDGVTKQADLTDFMTSRFSADPQVAQFIFNKTIERPKMLGFMETIYGRGTATRAKMAFQQYDIQRRQVKIAAGGPFTVPAYSAGTNTVVLPIDVTTGQKSAKFILPQIGEFLAVPPEGALLEITAVVTTGGTPSMTVRHQSTTGAALTIASAQECMLLTGKQIADCNCPTGMPRFPGDPLNYERTFEEYGDAHEWCGDAMNATQPFYVPFKLEDGSTVNVLHEHGQQVMLNDFMDSEFNRMLLHPIWGLIPTLKVKGTRIQHNSNTEVVLDDMYYIGQNLTQKGVKCMEYTVVCGINKYYQYQRLFNRENVANNGTIAVYDPSNSTKHLNLEWLKLSVGGLTLYVTHDPALSNGLGLGAPGYNFPNSEYWIPMGERQFDAKDNGVEWFDGGDKTKMASKIFFKSNDGRVFDNLTDSSGVLSTNGRNHYGPGCEKHKWTIKSRSFCVWHAPESWCIGGLF
jgi:hypothetical protein